MALNISIRVTCPKLGSPWAFHILPSWSFQYCYHYVPNTSHWPYQIGLVNTHAALHSQLSAQPVPHPPGVSCIKSSMTMLGSLQRPLISGGVTWPLRVLGASAVSHTQTPKSSYVIITLLLFKTIRSYCLVLRLD